MQDKQEAVTIFVNASAAVPENGLTEPGRAGKDVGQDTDRGRPGRAGQSQVPGSGTVHGQMQGGARVTLVGVGIRLLEQPGRTKFGP